MVLPSKLFASETGKEIGIQLYTLRNLVEEDFEGTLRKLARIGYKTIEAAGYNNGKFYGFEPQTYRRKLEDLGLIPLSSHSSVSPENIQKTIVDTLKAGMQYLVLPFIPQEKRQSLDDYKRLADELNKMGMMCKKAGLIFGYHNHDFEFHKKDNQVPFDLLLENTDPDYVTMELDIYWMRFARKDPIDYFERYPGRFSLWHVKDMADSPDKQTTEIGSGVIGFPTLFASAEQAGLKHYFVEQETFTIDPIQSVAQSFNYLNSL